MISSGLFILPGLAHAKAGPAVVLSYLLGGLLAGAGLLSIAELSTAMPKAGGDYFFITRGMGPAVGTVAGTLNWFSLSLKSAFAIVGMAAFARLLMAVNGTAAGVILAAMFVLINLKGAREAARLQVLVVVALLALMALYVIVGLPKVNVRHFEPFAPSGIRAVFSTAGFVFVSYGGLLKVAGLAEEIHDPGRIIPIALAASLLVVTGFYALMVFVTTGVLGAEQLDGSLTPISDAAEVMMGRGGYVLLTFAAMLAFVSTANAGVMAASRYLLALSRDGLLPQPLSRISSRFGSPYVAVLLTGAVIIVSLFMNLDVLVEAASTVLILSFIMSCLSVVVLRESRLQNYRPAFRCPLYPWIQIAGIIGFGFVLVEMGEETIAVSSFMVLISFLIYWFYGRKRSRHESALLHLIQRITARELVSGTLENELKTIIRQRDRIVPDRFDELIEASVVLDLDRPMSAAQFFDLVAEKLSTRLNIRTETLAKRLDQREAQSSTVIAPGLAIPHIVIEGESKFDILLARSIPGILFPQQDRPCHAVFVLVGTIDERNFHLRALAAIAQIVQQEDFEKRWMAARSRQALRDVVLLGQRQRANQAQP